MPRKLVSSLCAVALICWSLPAVAGTFDFDQGVNVKAVLETLKDSPSAPVVHVVEAAPGASAAASKNVAEWTIMSFINAKNNLESNGLVDVNEMERVGSTAEVNVVTELGRRPGYSSADGDWTGSRRYLIQKDDDFQHITSPVLQEIPDSDMGSWEYLVDFVKWAKTEFPARHYMLIVWDHGSGWDKAKGDMSTSGISYDDTSGNHITTAQLGQALAAMGGVDVYGSDACLMQMAEVAYEIRPYAEVIVGSEQTEPVDGWAFDTMLAAFTAYPGFTAEDAGRIAVDTYSDFYEAQGKATTLSAVRSAGLDGLLPKMSYWAQAVMGAGEDAMVKSAAQNATYFWSSGGADLADFVRLVDEGTASAELRALGEDLISYFQGSVLVYNRTTGSAYENAHGMDVYLPRYSYDSDYDALSWSQNGSWDEFAKWVSDLKAVPGS